MLQNIHDKAKGWIAYAIVGLIAVPFALFGINQYFEGGGKRVAAVVNGEDIPVQTVQNALVELRQQLGGRLPAGFDESSLKSTALDSVINQTLIQQKIKADGYRASDQEVTETIFNIPSFQKDGKFDKTTYENILKTQRRDPAEFESLVRNDLSQQQLRRTILETAFVPKVEAEQLQALRNQKRDLELFTLKTSDFKNQLKITNEQIQQYYDEHKPAFMTDERVKLAYIELKRDDLAASVKVDDTALKQWFDSNAERYLKPEERSVSHIVLAVDDQAKDADVKKKIDALYAELQAGKRSFEDIAKTESSDKNTAEKGGSMGSVVAADWGPEFEKAVNALKAGETSAPVKTESGYEIIRVSEIKPAVQKTYEEARAQVEDDYRKDQADKEFADKADKIQKLAFENEGDLKPVAQGVGLSVQESDWLSRVQGQGIATNPKVRNAAFEEEVKGGKNSELIEVEDGHAVMVRVINQEASTQKPLEAVREDILKILGDTESRKLATEKGEELYKKIAETQAWSSLADMNLGKEADVQKLTGIGRTDTTVPAEVVEQLFSLAHPATGKATWGKAVLANGDYSIIALKAVTPGDSKLEAGTETTYSQAVGGRELSALFQALRESAKIKMHPENL